MLALRTLLFLSFILLFMLWSAASLANQANHSLVKICIGEAYDNQWDQKVSNYLHRVFNAVGLQAEIHHAPTKRAELDFKSKKCDGFFASTKRFNQTINRQDIFYVPAKVLNVDLIGVANQSQPCQSTAQCLSSLSDSALIGTMASHGLHQFLSKKTKATLIELPTISQGIEMVKMQRLDLFILPQVSEANLPLGLSQLKSLDKLLQVDIFLWLDRQFLPYQANLKRAISAQDL